MTSLSGEERLAILPETISAVQLGLSVGDQGAAIDQIGRTLLRLGAVSPEYIPAMRRRELLGSTHIGNGIAIPHGGAESHRWVREPALVVLQFPGGVDWHGAEVGVCVGISTVRATHMPVLRRLAEVLADPRLAARLRTTSSVETVVDLLCPPGQDAHQRHDARRAVTRG